MMAAAASAQHRRQHAADHVGGAEIVDAKQAFHTVMGVVDQFVAGHQCRGVHQQVDGAGFLLYPRDLPLHIGQVADVAAQRANAVVLGAGRLEPGLVTSKSPPWHRAEASRRAMMRPMPLAPPVTRATLFCISSMA